MLFQLNITLTEDDYLAFNIFHSFESTHGKKQVQKSRIFFVAIMALILMLFIFVMGVTVFSLIYAAFFALFTVIYLLLFRKILNRNIKAQIRRLKKTGKLPFDSISTIEFYEEKLVEITPSKRMEQGYNRIERVCLVQDRFIFLYYSSVGAYILPVSQVSAQVNQDDFLSFLMKKCGTMEHYCNVQHHNQR